MAARSPSTRFTARCPTELYRGPFYRGQVLDQLMVHNVIPFSSAVVRRMCLQAIGGFDEGLRVAEDYDLWLRPAMNYAFDYVNDVLLDYRVGIDQIGSRVTDQCTPAVAVTRRFVERFYGGRYPRPGVVRKGNASNMRLTATYSLAAAGTSAHFGPMPCRWRIYFRPARYLAVLRDLVPNRCVAALRNLLPSPSERGAGGEGKSSPPT